MWLFSQERDVQRKQKVHEKTTYTYRINARTKSMIRPAGDTDDDLSADEDSNDEGAMVLKDDFVLTTTKGLKSFRPEVFLIFSYLNLFGKFYMQLF